jgi:hypothetical protein
MQVSTLSTSLHKQLSYDPQTKNITTQILSDVTRTVSKVKTLISWLDRKPFQGEFQGNALENCIDMGNFRP